MSVSITPDDLRDGARTFTICGVRRATIDGRPQLVLDLKDETNRTYSHVLTRDSARDLRRALGPHPLVDEFFRDGKGLQ
jgi:hypothetical protein